MGRVEVMMMGDLYGGLDGCVEGDVIGYSLKQECVWVHMMEICLGSNWVCARNGLCTFLGKFLSWI